MTAKQTLQPKLRFPEFDGDWGKDILKNLTNRIGDGLHGTPNYVEDSDFYFINGNNLLNGKIFITQSTKKVKRETYINNDKNLDENSLLISINGTVGSIAKYCNEKVMLGKSVGYLSFKNNRDFYFYLFQTSKIQDYFISELTGSTIKNLSLKTLREAEVLFPTTDEQTKIANFLSSIDEKINLLKEKKALLEAYKKGIMQKIFNQEIRFKDDNGNDFEDWKEKSLGEVAEFFKGKGLPKNHLTDDGSFKCIHYGELFIKYNELIKNVISRTDIYEKPFLSKSNDVLMPTSDVTPNGLATASCILDDNVILGGDVLIIRQKVKVLHGLFLAYYITQFRQKVMKLVSGSTVYHLYGSDMKNLEVLIPCMKEQTKIANFLSAIDEKIALVATQIQDTQEYKKGLLQQMFI